MVCEGRDYYSLEANILFGRTDVLTAHCSLFIAPLMHYTATLLHLHFFSLIIAVIGIFFINLQRQSILDNVSTLELNSYPI